MTERSWDSVSPYTEGPLGRFRPDLDVDEYVNRLGGGASRTLGGTGRPATAPPSSLRAPAPPTGLEPDRPMLVGNPDQADCSTCTDLVVLPAVVWDVNQYYAALNIPFPHRPVTRASLRRAYQDAEGVDDARKTFCFNQLLDAEVRAEYDTAPLGQPYIDAWWEEWLGKQARLEVSRRIAEGEVQAEEAEETDLAQAILEEWRGVSTPAPAGAGVTAPTPAPSPAVVPNRWPFYLWRCSYVSALRVVERMDTWRTLLVEACRARGIQIRFRVGFLGKQPHPWVRADSGGHLIFFLNIDQEPTTEYAEQAASSLQRSIAAPTPTPAAAI